MTQISVVIITRNEEHNIKACIRSARQLTDDVVVVDCGSDDRTVAMAKEEGARTCTIDWLGFGYSRNLGASEANHDWILALDADERITPQLALAIKNTAFDDKATVYKFNRRNCIGDKQVRFGTLGFERVRRIYHRHQCSWDLTLVHEKIISSSPLRFVQIRGAIIHYGLKSFEDYRQRARLYAQMSAEKYFGEGRKAGLFKRFGSPLFNGIKSYLFQLGFLDGKKGLLAAGTIAYYSWLKYDFLRALYEEEKITALYPVRPKMESLSN